MTPAETMRGVDADKAELVAEIEMLRDHNETLFALLLARDRTLAAVRDELEQVRALL